MRERERKPTDGRRLIAPIETTDIPKETLHSILGGILADGQPICITVTGSSMQPFLRHARDRVFLAPIEVPYNIKRGDILLYIRDDGSWVLHRVYRAVNGLCTMIGDGQWVLEPNVRREQVIARALRASRGGKIVSCERDVRNAMMKLYLCRMLAPRFFRRVFEGYGACIRRFRRVGRVVLRR